MARTHRNTPPMHRAAREARYAASDAAAPGEFPHEGLWLRRRFRGGMVMSPSACGVWDDCRPDDGPSRKAQRRALKRAERARAMREAAAEVAVYLAPEPQPFSSPDEWTAFERAWNEPEPEWYD